MNCTDSAVQLTISDQLNEDARHRQKKKPEANIKRWQNDDWLSKLKIRKGISLGSKNHFHNRKRYSLLRIGLCQTFCFVRERQKQVWLMEWNGISLSCAGWRGWWMTVDGEQIMGTKWRVRLRTPDDENIQAAGMGLLFCYLILILERDWVYYE